jgi:DNA-binding winged helix-turn-helix (wHTH) protein
MNGRNHEQMPTEHLNSYVNMVEGGREERNRTDFVLEAFSFGPFRILPHARLLEYDGSPMPISSRAFDLLCILISRPGQVVSKSELMAKAWPDLTVEESSLRFHVTMLRRALGGERYVVNVPGRGYCFVASVDRAA